jgi:hypothetical protein
MKKIIVTIFAFLYLAVSSGATVHLHFCMGKLINWELWNKKDNGKCSKCGMAKSKAKDGCCKDENKLVKIEKDQRVAEAAFSMQLLSVAVSVSFVETPDVPFLFVTAATPVSNSPPRKSLLAVYIRNCSFLI